MTNDEITKSLAVVSEQLLHVLSQVREVALQITSINEKVELLTQGIEHLNRRMQDEDE